MLTRPETSGHNLLGDGVIGNQANERRARFEYAGTPQYEADAVPRTRAAHIGGGVWLERCAGCDDYVLTYGHLAYNYDMSKHTATAHALEVAGYNTPLLPR